MKNLTHKAVCVAFWSVTLTVLSITIAYTAEFLYNA